MGFCGIFWAAKLPETWNDFQVVQKHLRYFSHQPRDGPVSARPQKILFGMFQLEVHMLSQAAMSGDDDAAVQDGVVAADETQESWRWGWYHFSILDLKARFVSTSYNVVVFFSNVVTHDTNPECPSEPKALFPTDIKVILSELYIGYLSSKNCRGFAAHVGHATPMPGTRYLASSRGCQWCHDHGRICSMAKDLDGNDSAGFP